MFCAPLTLAETPLEDVTLNLYIEIQDLVFDFDDEGEAVQKERIVVYALEVINQGGSTMHDLHLFMDSPDFMEYQIGSTTVISGLAGQEAPLDDEGEFFPLALGLLIQELPAGERITFVSAHQVAVPESETTDPLYTVAWASLVGQYSAIPVMSNPVNTIISGQPTGELSVDVTPFPSEDTIVFSGTPISYQYRLTNAGGLPVSDVTLVTYIPEGTECIESCGTIKLTDPLEAGGEELITMKVRVITTDPEKEYITNIGYDAKTSTMEKTELRAEHGVDINHSLNGEISVGSGEFTLLTEMVPNLVLNSPNEMPRPDQGDVSETQYALQYMGRGKPNTYVNGGSFGIQDTGNNVHTGSCKDHIYPHGKGSTVYAYNSIGGHCEKMSSCRLSSAPIQFSISTTLPGLTPNLILPGGTHSKTEIYPYGDTAAVNSYMQSGGVIKAPENFTLSRAITDGAIGSVISSVATVGLTEDLWTYSPTGEEILYATCSCGEDCTDKDYYPVYTWQETREPVPLEDDDTTGVSVYSSTAWLKTEGGHIGTNGAIINNETEANRVNLNFGGGAYMQPNAYVYDPDRILTPTNQYTRFGHTNADYMIFANQGNEAFVSAAGESWIVTGTDFGPQQHGESYDRANNPRNYAEDLLVREKFGKVYVDQLPGTLRGTVPIGDGVIWHQTGDLIIGAEGLIDTVTFTGGQSRIYVDGDAYINADIYYATNSGSSYNEVTSLRIDARNIYVSGEVTNLEVLLQAREDFHSGESYDQLRILGDVITGNAHWERKPVLELNPDEVNKPSEYIIEDLRKYVIPVPGDTEPPDEYDIWRQVNPSTGQVLDAY